MVSGARTLIFRQPRFGLGLGFGMARIVGLWRWEEGSDMGVSEN